MNNFNLLVSSSRFNEKNSKAELWFTLLMCGDKYPIISDLEFLGLITALSNLNRKDIVVKIKDILRKDPTFFQYILKIVPIDFVCETNVKVIDQIVQQNFKLFIKDSDSFKIDLKRRSNELIERNNFIETIAKRIDNKVDLEYPNVIIRIEVLGNYSGISFLKPDDIIRIKTENNDDDY